MRSVAAAAGVAERTLYLAFPTKAALLEAVLAGVAHDEAFGAQLAAARSAPVGHVLPLFARANAARLGRSAGMLGSGDDPALRSAAADIVAVLASWRALAGDVGSAEAAAIIEATASAPVYLRLVETSGWQATEYADWLVRVLAASLLDIVRQ
jgi:AcrR family transcriptional regulator